MKQNDPYGEPITFEPETVREALDLFNRDMMDVAAILWGVGAQLEFLAENEYPPGQPKDWRRKAIERGSINTLMLLARYVGDRIEDTEDTAMDKLPAEKPKGTGKLNQEEGGKK